jgi:hypothetical protein
VEFELNSNSLKLGFVALSLNLLFRRLLFGSTGFGWFYWLRLVLLASVGSICLLTLAIGPVQLEVLTSKRAIG